MFNKNHPFPLHPPLPHPFPSGDDILFHHHHDADILPAHYFPAPDAAFYTQHQDLGPLDPNPGAPKATKKDRHSKIYTSSGPRDRRVRLSIGVARRFFDLQEILGFDKPSKTLDWLLTNSTTAIKDLIQTKETENAAVSSSPSECEADSGDSKRKVDRAKESRVKARARARERTREKMCIKQLNDELSLPVQQFCRISGGSSSDSIFYSHPSDHQDQDESIVIKRKVKNFISANSNYGLIPSPNYDNPSENWDICAILDHHKFINSTSEN